MLSFSYKSLKYSSVSFLFLFLFDVLFFRFVVLFLLFTSVLKQNKKTNKKLYLTRVTLNSEITDKPVALGFQIELEFGNVGF